MNTHDRMLEALKRAKNHLLMDITRDGKGIHSSDTPEALIEVNAAIEAGEHWRTTIPHFVALLMETGLCVLEIRAAGASIIMNCKRPSPADQYDNKCNG